MKCAAGHLNLLVLGGGEFKTLGEKSPPKGPEKNTAGKFSPSGENKCMLGGFSQS